MRAWIAFGLVLPLLAGAWYVLPSVVIVDVPNVSAEPGALRPDETLDVWILEPGDLCSVAGRAPATIPGILGVDVHAVDGTYDAAASLRAANTLEDAFPGINFAPSPGGLIDIQVTDHDLQFNDEELVDVNGLACGTTVLIEERRLETSTLVHEVGHVLGLDHEQGSWMATQRVESQADDWSQWTPSQTAHLAQFTAAGAPWP